MNSLRGCFVTGTDTEIGKTCASAALLQWFAQQGLRSAGLKPVAAGIERGDGEAFNEDVRALRQASSVPLSEAEVGPCQFDEPCAPHIAAQLERRPIEQHLLLEAAQSLSARADVLVIEGVGGFCVPLGAAWDTADLAVAFGLPVVLVIGLRLGCLNHALLTAEAVRARGLRLAGWIGNTLETPMPWLDQNLQTLHHEFTRRHQAPCLGLLPWLEPFDAAVAAKHLDDITLRTALCSGLGDR